MAGKYEADVPPTGELISKQARTRIYVGSLVLNVVAGVALVVVLALELVPASAALAIFGAVTWGLNQVSTSLAVGYRPTRPPVGGTQNGTAV